MLNKRGCGVLLHPTSLPSPGGIGTLGADARRFIDLLAAMGMSYWQVLPLAPPACGNSPYSGLTAFGGNPLLIDLDALSREGDLPPLHYSAAARPDWVDFAAVTDSKMALLAQAGAAFLAQPESSRTLEFQHFCVTHSWLNDFALFMVLKEKYQGVSWNRWPAAVASPTPEGRRALAEEFAREISVQKYLQWQFAKQWQQLRVYANAQGIAIIGDIPIFVAYDSAEVWSHRELFLLDRQGRPSVVAGVPPDYFSATGQLWGNPHYDWDLMATRGFAWWIERFRSMFELFDILRVDHFRGFEAAWQVAADATTAEQGCWAPGPGEKLFDVIAATLGHLPIIAEDLGVITPAVLALRDRYQFPGMKILQFAFDTEPINLPHHHRANGVVYTGTHDNDTSQGWYDALSKEKRQAMQDYLGCAEEDGAGTLIRTALMSVADTAILPLQDLLRLGSAARMNIPGTPFGNWEWRFSWEMLPPDLVKIVQDQLQRYDRLNKGEKTDAP
ncbi:MAG: 4-alpha-glucanotransferase [Desulfuromonadales bacterium]|nr:4-alpha-glucanotransferase [Desulfuromonadales bacterium]